MRICHFWQKNYVIIIAGAAALAEIMKDTSSLNFVSLEWNQLGSDGARSLSEALTFNTSLQHLDLRNNNIGDDGAMAFVKALSSNDTLRTLDLRWNQVSAVLIRTNFRVLISLRFVTAMTLDQLKRNPKTYTILLLSCSAICSLLLFFNISIFYLYSSNARGEIFKKTIARQVVQTINKTRTGNCS